MTNFVEKAIGIALEAHWGERDKAQRPYVLHPLRLMLEMETEDEMVTAVLHDVIEDSHLTLKDLRAAGFSQTVLTALTLLTHDKDTLDYDAYIARLQTNPLARKVKLADLTHNMDVRRLPSPLTEPDLARLEKYRRAWVTLTAA